MSTRNFTHRSMRSEYSATRRPASATCDSGASASIVSSSCSYMRRRSASSRSMNTA